MLDLQLTDSAIDQIRLRLPRLAEVVAARAATAEVVAWDKRSADLTDQIARHEAAIANAEAASAAISTQRARLEKQLKTVIVPREVEALMHEIAQLNGKRSALDDDELEAMDALAGAESEMAEHEANEPLLREAAANSVAAAAVATAAAEADLVDKIAIRDGMRAAFDSSTLARYDTMRSQHNGQAIAKLNGLRCEGCHLDLSRGEVDDIKRMPEDELAECPNCGRLLVR